MHVFLLSGTNELMIKKLFCIQGTPCKYYLVLCSYTKLRRVINSSFLHAFFYKNTLYKNVHDENGQKIKNIVRILPSWKFSIFFFRIYLQMHLKHSRADLADLFYFIFLIAFSFLCIHIRKFSVFTLLFDDFETMTGKI